MINLKKLLGLEMYVSELDTFLNQYDQNQTKHSDSKQQEKDKHALIRTKRDQEQAELSTNQSLINKLLN